MTLQDSVTAGAFGALFALLGAIILFVLQALQKRSDDRRAFLRAWHDEIANLLADVRMVTLPTFGQGSALDGQEFYGPNGLHRRIFRINAGHPDKHVRAAAFQVLVPLGTLALWNGAEQVIKREGSTAELDRNEMHKDMDRLREALNALEDLIHGGRPNPLVFDLVALNERNLDLFAAGNAILPTSSQKPPS